MTDIRRECSAGLPLRPVKFPSSGRTAAIHISSYKYTPQGVKLLSSATTVTQRHECPRIVLLAVHETRLEWAAAGASVQVSG